MEIDHAFNYNDPVEVTCIFRIAEPSGGKAKEYGGKVSFGWEDIKVVEEYPHIDDWESYRGDKCWIQLHNDPNAKLVLGSYQNMSSHWRNFRNKFPMFVERRDEDDDNND